MKISQEITALFRKQIQRNGSLLRLLATGLVVLVIMLVLTGPSRFLSAKSISAMMLQMPELGILTLAVTFALFLGGIDLSVVSTANLSGIIAGCAAQQEWNGQRWCRASQLCGGSGSRLCLWSAQRYRHQPYRGARHAGHAGHYGGL